MWVGDHLTLLNVFRAYSDVKTSKKRWCYDHFINIRSMKQVFKVRHQLKTIFVRKCKLRLLSCGMDTVLVRRCLVSGFFLHVARLQVDGTYRTMVDGQVGTMMYVVCVCVCVCVCICVSIS